MQTTDSPWDHEDGEGCDGTNPGQTVTQSRENKIESHGQGSSSHRTCQCGKHIGGQTTVELGFPEFFADLCSNLCMAVWRE